MKYEYCYFIDINLCKIITIIILVLRFHNGSNEINISENKISIIIPTYNRAHLILKSIQSVLKQTYNNIEVLIIDDGSTDNTSNLVNNLNDSRIKYFKLNKNKGGSFARNFGILKASGKYISFQDSDDLYHPKKIEIQYKNLIKKGTDLDFCKICIHINEKKMFVFPDVKQEKNITKGKIVEELCFGNFISTQSILVKKKYIKKYLFDTKFPRLQDYDLALRIIPKVKVSYTNKILVDLYREKDSIGNSGKKYNESLELLLMKKYDIKCDMHHIYNIFKKNKE